MTPSDRQLVTIHLLLSYLATLSHTVAHWLSIHSINASSPSVMSTDIDWLIEQCLTSQPTQYRLSGRQFYRPKTQPTVSKYWRKNDTKVKKTQKKIKLHKMHNTINRHTYNPLVYNNTTGWLWDGSHRGQGRQAWMVVGPQFWGGAWKDQCHWFNGDGVEDYSMQ